jgi:hypothetical protein
MKKYLFASLIVFFAAFSASAQSFRGSISGQLRDASGASLTQGRVSARNLATAAVRSSSADSSGAFSLRELPAGDYEVSVESTGLRTVVKQVKVSVGLDTSVDFELNQLKEVVQQVQVTAAAPLIEPTRDTLSQVVENRLVIDFPLNGRDRVLPLKAPALPARKKALASSISMAIATARITICSTAPMTTIPSSITPR